ncbi:MAG: hypothetical protein HEQ39_09705 [Rhizobacter sp.]
MANSTRYRIHQVFKTVLTPVAASNSAALLTNPVLPVGLKEHGNKVLFTLDRGDDLIAQPAQKEERQAKVVVGAFVRSDDADNDADQLHFAARTVIKRIKLALTAQGIDTVVREVQTEPELKEHAVDGALLLSSFEVKYKEIYPEP